MSLTDFTSPETLAKLFGGLVALAAAFKSLLEFYDNYLGKRRLQRYSYLQSESKDVLSLADVLSTAKHEEIARILFGHSLSPATSDALMSLYQSRHFSLEELRAIAAEAQIQPNGNLEVSRGVGSKLIFLWSLASSLYVLLFGFFSGFVLLEQRSPSSLLAALLVFVITFAIALLLASDGRNVFKTTKAGKKLATYYDGNLTLPSSGLPSAAAHVKR